MKQKLSISAIVMMMISTNLLYSQPSTSVQQKYEQAYNKILEGKWEEALAEMQDIVKNNAKSEWGDDAFFWKCYAQSKITDSQEQSFACFKLFLKTYPDSKWCNDAEMYMLQIANNLAKTGKPEYKAFVKSYQKDSDIDLKISALHALMNMGNEKALDAILELYENTKEPVIVEKLIFSLSEFDNPKATDRLNLIATQDPNPRFREKAVFWLSERSDNKETAQFIYNIALSDSDLNVCERALMGLADIDYAVGMPFLKELAKNHKDAKIREKAVFWIGDRSQNNQDIRFLMHIALNDPDYKIREQAVFALADADNDQGKPYLQKIVLTHKDAKIREKAVFWLGDKAETKEDIDFLYKIVNTDPDTRIREKALFAIADADDDIGIDALINIAKKHPDYNLRKKAIFWLGDSGNEKAENALLEIIKSSK